MGQRASTTPSIIEHLLYQLLYSAQLHSDTSFECWAQAFVNQVDDAWRCVEGFEELGAPGMGLGQG